MIVVVDASVAVKWALRDLRSESDGEQALAILGAIARGEASAVQPPHWLLEVAAVLVRLWPQFADEVVERLDLMELPIAGDAAILRRATQLARQLDHHLFDTLYHAVALEREGLLITADPRYVRKARSLGRVVELRHWTAPLA